MMLTPKASDTTTAQLFDATTGGLMWEYTAGAGEGVMWALEAGGGSNTTRRAAGSTDEWAVVAWWSGPVAMETEADASPGGSDGGSGPPTLTFNIFDLVTLPGAAAARSSRDGDVQPSATFTIAVPAAPVTGPAVIIAAARNGAALAIAVQTLGVFYVDVSQPAPKPVLVWDTSSVTPAVQSFNALSIDTADFDAYIAVDATVGHMVGGGGLTMLKWTGTSPSQY